MTRSAASLSAPRQDGNLSVFAHTTGLMIGAALLAGACQLCFAKSATAEVIWQDGRPVFNSERRSYRQEYDRREFEYRQPPRRYFQQYPAHASGGPRPSIAPLAPPVVPLRVRERPGTVVIDTADRHLYYMISPDRAYAYPISVGRDGFRWTGTHKVSRIQAWPDWHPPAEMRARQPGLPVKMDGGMRNPLGAKALYLGSTLYRIHGTNDPRTIGRAASSGCFRMMNEHVMHLATLVDVGTEVRVMKRYDGVAQPALSRLDPPRMRGRYIDRDY